MKRYEWPEVFASLPDTAFFELVRHYLGPVETPFHKPEIVKRMDMFFKRPEIIQRCREFIDLADARLLSCVALSENATETFLKTVLQNIRPLTLKKHLYNLEERLLLWRSNEVPELPYRLTPLGLTLQNENFFGLPVLLGDSADTIEASIHPWYNDNFFNFALNFLLESHPLFRREGGLRKKTLELLKERFHMLFNDERGEERLLLAGRGFLATKLVQRSGDRLEANLENWRDMEQKSPEERRMMMIAMAAVGRSLSTDSALRISRCLTETLDPGKAYPLESLISLIQIASGKKHPPSPQTARRLLDHFYLMGELAKTPDGKMGRPLIGEVNESRLLNISGIGDISVYPGMPLFCDLAMSCKGMKFDMVSEYHLNKDCFFFALENGLDKSIFLEKLQDILGHGIPQNIITFLSEWEKEFQSISMRLAVVFRADGSYRTIVDETGVLDDYCIDKVAPGIWILDYLQQDAWRKALAGIGMSWLPNLRDNLPREMLINLKKKNKVQCLPWHKQSIEFPIRTESREMPHFFDYEPILDSMAADPRVETMTESEKDIFLERLQRRIILNPEQIQPQIWRYEVMTAKGLDYQGKLRLAEAAMSGRNEWLEVTVSAVNDVKTQCLVPESLHKEGSEHILSGISVPEELEVRYSVRKIGFMKKIKISLF